MTTQTQVDKIIEDLKVFGEAFAALEASLGDVGIAAGDSFKNLTAATEKMLETTADWMEELDEDGVCTCPDDEQHKRDFCKGQCGCEFCHNMYSDYLSGAGDW